MGEEAIKDKIKEIDLAIKYCEDQLYDEAKYDTAIRLLIGLRYQKMKLQEKLRNG